MGLRTERKGAGMKETIWINLDPERIDLSTLERRFAGKYRLIARAIPGNAPELVLEQAKQADVVISILEKWDEEALKKVRGKVRMLQKYGMGLDNIDCAAAARCGIPVANVIGANSAAVAEVALMHILNISRHFTSAVSSVKSGRWQFTTGSELDGKTVGLLGLGHIARHLVRMLSGFRMEVLAYDPFVTQAPEGVTLVDSREELFRRSHIVSLHIPCTAETQGSIDRTCFALMPPGAALVNTCRGGVVNEEDLVQALRSGHLSAAGLDVLAQEPPRPDNPLVRMDNVFITPHLGAETFEAGRRSQEIMADNIEMFLERGELSSLVQNRAAFCVEKGA